MQCNICSQPLRRDNKVGVCQRTSECRTEYNWRRYKSWEDKVEPFVYVIHFRDAGICKLGHASYHKGALSRARSAMRKRGYPASGVIIWRGLGDETTEHYLQAMFSLRYQPTFGNRNRMSEWFITGGVSPDKLVNEVSHLYDAMPSREYEALVYGLEAA